MQNLKRGMEKVTKFVRIVTPKMAQIPANCPSPQISQNIWDVIEKNFFGVRSPWSDLSEQS